jgi:NAD-dependent deacetylase
MIVAGTSSVVYPAASLPGEAKARCATIIEFNREFPTPLSELADFAFRGRVLDTLPPFVQEVLEKKKKRQNTS